MSNTKQEMLDAYQEVLRQLQERREEELKPEEKVAERVTKQAVEVADSLSTEGIVRDIGALRLETGNLLSQLSERLEEEVNKYRQVKKAVDVREQELQEIYEIERSAGSLAALIEAQHQKREEFEAEMATRREQLNQEIQNLRTELEQEKKRHEAEVKERDVAEGKRRERERGEYQYAFQREQQLAREQFEDEKVRLERELRDRREQMERELGEREKVVAASEQELEDLRKRVSAFPKELETAVNKAVKEAVDRVQVEAKAREEFLKKEFDGERNVLLTRIEGLEKTVKEQNQQMTKMSQQLEKAYGQVQDIALKAIEGSSSKALGGLQQWATEQPRRPAPEQ